MGNKKNALALQKKSTKIFDIRFGFFSFSLSHFLLFLRMKRMEKYATERVASGKNRIF
jgi:hypothetical protein